MVLDRDHPLNRSLVAWWSFSGGGGSQLFDFSGFGKHGTLQNSPSWTTGRFGHAITFNGSNQYVDVGAITAEFNVNECTIFARIYRTFVNTVSTDQMVFSTDVDANNRFLIYYRANQDKWSFQTRRGGTTDEPQTPDADTIAINTWQSCGLTCSASGDFVKAYANGIYQAQETTLGTWSGTLANGFIGQWNSSRYWTGAIDDIRLYSRVLTDQEMFELDQDPYSMIWQPRAFFFVPAGTAYTKELTESFTLTDTPNKASTRPISETLSLTDLILKLSSRQLTESVTLSDNLTKLLLRIVTETISISDVLDLVVVFVKELSETLTLTDTVAKLTGKPLTEGVTLTDTQTHAITRSLIESLSLTDLVSRLTSKTINESITLSDAITTAIVFVKLLTETLSLSDSTLKTVNRSLLEGLTLTDTIPRDTYKTFLESLGIADTFTSESVSIVVARITEVILSAYYNIDVDLSAFYSLDIELD